MSWLVIHTANLTDVLELNSVSLIGMFAVVSCLELTKNKHLFVAIVIFTSITITIGTYVLDT